MKIWLSILILILALGCQKPKKVVLNDDDPIYTVDNQGNIFVENNDSINLTSISDNQAKTQISFQTNRLIINFNNGSSLIFKPCENLCNEWELEKNIDICQEEYFLAAICKDEDNSSIICSNDTVFWEFNIQLTHNKEGVDSTQLKIKKLKNQKKSLQGKMVLENAEKKSIF